MHPSDPLDSPQETLARLDLDRRRRLGMVEAIWGEHKSAEQIAGILRRLQTAGELALVTRVAASKATDVEALLQASAAAEGLVFHCTSRCLTQGQPPAPRASAGRSGAPQQGSPAVVAGEAGPAGSMGGDLRVPARRPVRIQGRVALAAASRRRMKRCTTPRRR